MLDQALATWDWTLSGVLLSSSEDIALLKSAQPVTDVSPVAVNKSAGELGQIVNIMGNGAKGNGVTGHEFSSARRTELRHAYSKVNSAHGRWFCYVFNEPSEALPLEGGSGSGGSGGPILMQARRDWPLAGLTSWADPRAPSGRLGGTARSVVMSA